MLIMTFATKSLSSVPVGFARVAVRGAAAANALVKALLHRRQVLRLSELDERALKDIGLVRSDVEGALAISWLDDPSAILAARSAVRADVASARREEGFRQAALKPDAASIARPAEAQSGGAHTIACGA